MMRRRALTAYPGALLLLVLVLPLALTLHLVGMGEHGMDMLGACFAVVQAAALLIGVAWIRRHTVLSVATAGVTVVLPIATPIPMGRYPPDEGTILRH